MELQGQQETLRLLQVKEHLAILDGYGDEEHQSQLSSYAIAYDTWKEAQNRQEELILSSREALRYEELWRSQREEILHGELEEGEEELLYERLKVIREAERLGALINAALDSLGGNNGDEDSVQTLLYQAKRDIAYASGIDDSLAQWAETADSLYWQLDELRHDLTRYLANIEDDPDLLDELEERQEQIAKLKRKYGDSINIILAYCRDLSRKLEELEYREEDLEELKRECQVLEVRLLEESVALSRSRHRVSAKLEEEVMFHLQTLLMAECRFQVAFVDHDPTTHRSSGQESCEFHIAPNPGEPFKPLAQIASGGELARILLSLKKAFIAVEMPELMVFDEPDSGLSGAAVQAMAKVLQGLGEKCQLLLVTHQAAVAAVASSHYLLFKESNAEQTFSYVRRLDHEGRLQEMVRLLAADESSTTARKHAEELLRGLRIENT